MAKLTIVRGLPGSGKSTFARMYAEDTGASHWENDMFFMVNGEYKFDPNFHSDAIAWCRGKVFKDLSEGKNVVVSNTFCRLSTIEVFLEYTDKHGHEVEFAVMRGNYGSIHNVPDEVISTMKSKWQELPEEWADKYEILRIA